VTGGSPLSKLGRSAARIVRVWTALAFVASCRTHSSEPAPELVPDPLREQRLALARTVASEGVTDSATLAAIRAVPRHEFVPPAFRALAYADQALPIGLEQTISQPTVVGVMTQALEPRAGLRVLEIGTGSGYQAAVLAEIGCVVYTIELLKPLADSARVRLQRLGYGGVQVRHGDGYLGWPEAAPFEAIMLTAAPDSVPPVLIRQLAPGGRLVAPVGGEHEVQELIVVEKSADGTLTRRTLLPVRFVPMRRGER
jgi:protein-L-isoaspartate(D-aspartate) O-methyltransferase